MVFGAFPQDTAGAAAAATGAAGGSSDFLEVLSNAAGRTVDALANIFTFKEVSKIQNGLSQNPPATQTTQAPVTTNTGSGSSSLDGVSNAVVYGAIAVVVIIVLVLFMKK